MGSLFFSMMFYVSERLFWPSEARAALEDSGHDHEIPASKKSILLLRSQRAQEAEALLLSALVSDDENTLIKELYCGLLARAGHYERAIRFYENHVPVSPLSAWKELDTGWKLRRLQLLLVTREYSTAITLIRSSEHGMLFSLAAAEAYMQMGDIHKAYEYIEISEAESISPESTEIKARLHLQTGREGEAVTLLSHLLEQGVQNPTIWDMILHLCQTSTTDYALRLQQAINRYTNEAKLRSRAAAFALTRREPALSRFNSLKERLTRSGARPTSELERSDSNLYLSYEHLGQTELLAHLERSASARLLLYPYDSAILSNRALQLASLASKEYASYAERLARNYKQDKWIRSERSPGIAERKLRVALVTPDLHYHPVGRFVHMLLHAGLGSLVELSVVATKTQGNGPTKSLLELISENCKLYDFRTSTEQSRELGRLRDLKLDIAIDLAGWTGGNAAYLFGPRIAAVQINYLGFFASSGLDSMDFWLGDNELFPNPMREWHSEKIWRLPRCFLAWQPCSPLPEAVVEVPNAPSHSDIVFGCFNHNRKLSDKTLRLWAKILQATPGSRLALKAYTSDDPGTVKLLRRRMMQAGLDLMRVVWLKTCPDPVDHLRQYCQMDIALDPFPNGGCTTSCEALWMGVPVITLQGSHYVSRMTSAVLKGAGLNQWIANTELEYLQKAVKAADQLRYIRSQRQALRQQIKSSELGDARGLAKSLQDSFRQMLSS